jgi:hypothetical protein
VIYTSTRSYLSTKRQLRGQCHVPAAFSSTRTFVSLMIMHLQPSPLSSEERNFQPFKSRSLDPALIHLKMKFILSGPNKKSKRYSTLVYPMNARCFVNSCLHSDSFHSISTNFSEWALTRSACRSTSDTFDLVVMPL